MSPHPSDRELRRFVACELDQDTAVHVACHVDDCPACNARTTALDPLAAAFAATDDPPIPADLVESVLRGLEAPQAEPSTVPGTELILSAALLAAGLLVFVVLGNPWALALDLLAASAALLHAASVVVREIGQAIAWWAMGASLLFAGVLALLTATAQVRPRRSWST